MSKQRRKERIETPRPRDLERIEPDRFLSPFEEMERWFEDRFPHYWPRGFRWGAPPWRELDEPFFDTRLPRMDVLERDDAIIVRAELPGVNKEDLDVSLSDDAITIRAETSHKSEDEKGDYYRSEIARGLFSRTLALPSAVDGDKVEAKFHNGVLELKLPKHEQAKRRRIEVA